MIYPVIRFSPLCLSLFILTTPSVANEIVNLPTIEIEERLVTPGISELPVYPSAIYDSGELLKSLPGANINRNGPLSGVAQYRGYFGDRVNVRIGDVHLEPAGPNAMDAPMSYLPSILADSIQLERGISRVSSGIETVGGTIIGNSLRSEFQADDNWISSGRAAAGFSDVNDGLQTSLFTSIANRSHRLHLGASRERGNDYEFDGGVVEPSEHDRDSVRLGYGFRSDNGQQFSLDYSYDDTGKTGTPALPMDIAWVRSDVVRLGFETPFSGNRRLQASIDYQDSRHLMTNYHLRTPPLMMMGMMPMPMNRHAYTDVVSLGTNLSVSLPLFNGEAEFGFNSDQAEHNAVIGDPTNAMFHVDNFNNAQRDLFSLFGEWQGAIAQDWQATTGLRVTRVDTDADTVNHSMAMMNGNIAALRNRFNSADRSQSDTNADLALELRQALSDSITGLIGIAHKQRAPSYQERYLWVPLQSTGGLADGNTYVGNINLDPEQSMQFELGLEIVGNRGMFSPRIFFHRVDDYIQGVPATDALVTAVDATALQFANVDAQLSGFDIDWQYQLADQWQLRGVVSYVRGKRRDIGDDLYRIAPLNGLTALHYLTGTWDAELQLEAYASQSKVSTTNGEAESAGYAITNLRLGYQARNDLQLTFGVDNLFDRDYRPHLGGSNRVNGVDLAPGERIPGPGRNLYLVATMEW